MSETDPALRLEYAARDILQSGQNCSNVKKKIGRGTAEAIMPYIVGPRKQTQHEPNRTIAGTSSNPRLSR